MELHYANSRPGSGKTYFLTKMMATRPGKWVYACDRTEVFVDRRKMIEDFSRSKNLKIVECNSNTTKNVRLDIKDAPDVYSDEKNIVLMITHEGLMSSDLSHYAGWSLCIDETPLAWKQEDVTTKHSKHLLANYFTFQVEKGSDYPRIRVKQDVDIDGIATDSYVNEIMGLYKAVKNGKVYCNIVNWDDAEKWDWWTVWNFNDLENFDNIYLVANAFEQSLTYKLMKSHSIILHQFDIPEYKRYLPRNLTVKYFDKNNRATAYFFQGKNGKDAMRALNAYFKNHKVDIWSCNHDKRGVKYANLLDITGKKLLPIVAGSNEYISYTSAAFIYTAKPGKTEIARLADFGISFDEIVRAREIEVILQFVTRLSIRNAEDDRDCEFYVYDSEQAEAVKEFFDNLNIGINTIIEGLDFDIPKVFKSKEDRKSNKSALNRAAYAKRKLERAKSDVIDMAPAQDITRIMTRQTTSNWRR